MRTKHLFGFAVLLFFTFGCDPKKEPETPQDQDFSCIKLFDEIGQDLGLHGSCTSSNDWGKITLNASEQALLNFNDTVSLSGTVKSNISNVFFFPNPVKIEAAFQLYIAGSMPGFPVKLKIAIVDESLNVVKTLALQLQVGHGVAMQIDPSIFQSGKYYRLYYRLSATGAASLYEGYGNFLVCKTYIDGVNTTIESDCL